MRIHHDAHRARAMKARASTKRHGQRITINSDGSANLDGVRCKNFEAAVRLADIKQRMKAAQQQDEIKA